MTELAHQDISGSRSLEVLVNRLELLLLLNLWALVLGADVYHWLFWLELLGDIEHVFHLWRDIESFRGVLEVGFVGHELGALDFASRVYF